MFCSHCGGELANEARFCSKYGAKVINGFNTGVTAYQAREEYSLEMWIFLHHAQHCHTSVQFNFGKTQDYVSGYRKNIILTQAQLLQLAAYIKTGAVPAKRGNTNHQIQSGRLHNAPEYRYANA